MSRTFQDHVFILKTRDLGENHRSVKIFTRSRGIIEATVYGVSGKKNPLRGSVQPLTMGRCSFYHDPVRDRYRLQDFDPLSLYEGIKGDLEKYYCALFWIEIIIRMHAGGDDSSDFFSLLMEAADILEIVEDKRISDRLQIQFLWRLLGLAGFRPDIGICESCGKQAGSEKNLYLDASGHILCGDCSGLKGNPLTPGARRYLEKTENTVISECLKIGMDERSLKSAKAGLIDLIQGIIGSPLTLVKTGGDLL